MRKGFVPIAIVLAATMLSSGYPAVAEAFQAHTHAGGEVGATPPSHRLADKPNILMIVSDDQPTDQRTDLQQYMPYLMRMVEQGIDFPNASVAYPLCCPSRATGMSGRYAHNTGVKDLETGSQLDPQTTVQYALQEAGYNTAIVGKYLQGIRNNVRPPYFDCSTTWLDPNYYHFRANVEGDTQEVDRYSTTYSGRKVRQCLQRFEASDEHPWYAYWAPHAPHKSSAYHGTAQPEQKYRDADVPDCVAPGERNMSDKLPYLRHHSLRKKEVRRFCENAERALMTLDDELARVMRWLHTNGERNTLVIYWSDNGVLSGQHNRIGKSVPYLPSVQVPMFMWWPGRIDAGIDNRLAMNVDLAPTILSAAGVQPQTLVDGQSLFGDPTRLVQYSESFIEKDLRVVLPKWFQLLTPGAWSYIEDYLPSGRVYAEYYDLSTDPKQHHNLLGDSKTSNDPPPEQLSYLHDQLQLARECAGTQEQGSLNPCP